VSMLQPRALQKGITLQATPPQGQPLAVQGDPGRLRQVLFNLVGNAVKFTERGGVHVEVRAHEVGATRLALSIAVRDTGIGISAEQSKRLFTEFTQADTSTARRFGGSGLGLAISRELVELMGGHIELASAPGVGSTFTLRLELERADPAQIEARVAKAEPAAGVPGAPRGLRVLVAEDNSVNQVLIRGLLTRMGQYLDVVSDGAEALRQVQAAPYDLVLMDVQMPQMDGIQATRAIRSLGGAVGRLPIIAMTANVMQEDRAACEAAGMDGFVGKPLDRAQLQQVIRDAMARRDNLAHATGK
jgi:CheY-like chemotaxis protein